MRAGQEAAESLEVDESATPVDAQDFGTDGAILSLLGRGQSVIHHRLLVFVLNQYPCFESDLNTMTLASLRNF